MGGGGGGGGGVGAPYSNKATVVFFCYFCMAGFKLSAVNSFDLRFSACVHFSNGLSWYPISELIKFYFPRT